MSGFLGSLTGLASGALPNLSLNTLTGIATGGLLLLGPVPFLDFALPEKVRFGGGQQMTVHKLPGGARVFDLTGLDEAPITWGGIFLGPTSELFRRLLEGIRDKGDPVDLIVGFQSRLVLIRDLQFEQGHLRVDYQITCEVVPDPGPEEEDDEDEGLGDGEAPETPQAAQDQGQRQVVQARRTAVRRPTVDPFAPSRPAYSPTLA